ncbi:transposase [Micromonospora sp. SL1-18]|uniref:transposase n=1 Tax=Micromonospora sp. SL1-18 TaxID=3399128 RepID=UPI003A4DAAA0
MLAGVLECFAGRFGRVEPRRAAAAFVTGLLADLEAKTCWQLAEQAGHARPDAMQRLLYRAVWDADAVRDDLRGFGSVKDGKLYYLFSEPKQDRYHLTITVRDLATGKDTNLPEILTADGHTSARLYAPLLTAKRLVIGVDQHPNLAAGLWSMNLDGSEPAQLIDEESADAPMLGDYDATDAAVTFEDWPGDAPPSINQIAINGSSIRPMTCATGVHFMVNADTGTGCRLARRVIRIDLSGDASTPARALLKGRLTAPRRGSSLIAGWRASASSHRRHHAPRQRLEYQRYTRK